MDYSNRLNSSPAGLQAARGNELELGTKCRKIDGITTRGGEEEGTDEP